MLTATVFLSSSEEMLDSGLPLVDADEFLLLSAASSEEVLDSGLLLVDADK